MFLLPALFPHVLAKILAEHVTDQFRLLIPVAPCWMEVPWLPKVLHVLADGPYWCPIVKDLIVDVSVGQVLRGLQSWHLTFWLLRDVFQRQGFSCLICIVVVGVTSASMTNIYLQYWKERTGWCAEEGVPNNAISAPKIADILVHLFRVGLTWHTIGLYHSAISAFFGT